MKKILSMLLAVSMVSLFIPPMSVRATNNSTITVRKVKGIVRTLDSEVNVINSESEFNYVLDEVNLSVNGSTINIQTHIDSVLVEFNPKLYESQLGYNAENTVFGIDTTVSSDFKLTKFTIEKNAGIFALMAPNEYMVGNTVVSLAIYNSKDNKNYYFQFITNGFGFLDAQDNSTDMVDYELANFSAQPYEKVKADLDSLKIEIKSESNMETSATSQALSDHFVIPNTEETLQIPTNSEESRVLDQLLEQSKKEPISMSYRTYGLVPDIPDYLYKSQTSGWEHRKTGYRDEGSNASRDIGYVIYHMPDTYSGNAMNYVMRYEAVGNYNWDSQRFVHSFIITHNLWIQYLASSNQSYVFDDRAWNARIKTEADTYVRTTTNNGYFTHFQTATISHGSLKRNIIRAIIAWVPKLSETLTSYDEISSGIRLETGVIHPTRQYAKEVEATMDNLKYPNDHVTIEGLGTGIGNISYGYSYSVWAN